MSGWNRPPEALRTAAKENLVNVSRARKLSPDVAQSCINKPGLD